MNFKFIFILIGLLSILGCDRYNDEILPQIAPEQVEENEWLYQNINLNRPHLRVFYVEPSGQPNPPTERQFRTYARRIDKHVKEAREFFEEEMFRGRYGRKTFDLITDKNGRVIVERIKVPGSIDYYLNHSKFYAIREDLEEILGSLHDLDTREIRLFFADLGGHRPGVCGFGQSRSVNGHALVFGGCWDNDTICHELGHALGLHHDLRNDNYIMSINNPNRNRFSRGAREWISRHPSFNDGLMDHLHWAAVYDFEIGSMEPIGNNKYNLLFKFKMDYHPEGNVLHPQSLDDIFHNGVLINKSKVWPEVLTFFNKNKIFYKQGSERRLLEQGPKVFHFLEYEVKTRATIPQGHKHLRLRLMSRDGRVRQLNTILP